MGLAASQARALLLVARKSDIEYRMQCLTQRKMVLATQTEQIAKDYTNKLNKKTLKFVYNVDSSSSETKTEDLTYASLMLNPSFIGQYRITDSMGRVVVPSAAYIPQQEVEVPKYTKVSQNDDGSYSKVINNKTVPSQTTTALGTSTSTDSNGNKIYPEIYLPTNTEAGYVKIQNSDGTLVTNATVVDSNNTSINVFSKTGEGNDATTANYTMTSELQNWYKYTMVTTSEAETSTSFNSEADAKAAGYVQLNGETEKVLVDRQPVNGKYYTDDGKEYIIAPELMNQNYLQNGLRNGALYLQKANVTDQTDSLGNKVGEYISWTTQSLAGSDVIQEVADPTLQAKAEAEYEMKTAVISAQDKMLDTEIKQLETQHKAIETEEESVKKIIQDNIKNTFSTFKA